MSDLAYSKAAQPTVFMLSDVTDKRNPLKKLDELHEKMPSLRVTVFAVPGQTSESTLQDYIDREWIRLGCQGYHGASFECAGWMEDESYMKMEELREKWPGSEVFRAPNWATNELVEDRLERMGWVSVCSGTTLESWGNTRPMRYVYNCAPVDSIAGTANNLEWADVLDGTMDFRFATDFAERQKYDLDQEVYNSWSHESKYGQRAIRRMKLLIDMVEPEGPVADFGGNDGEVAAYAASRDVDVTVIDNSISRVAYAREVNKVRALRENIESLSFSDNEFEWGFTSHTLEHMENLDKAWSEIKRVCAKGCLVAVPTQGEHEFETDPSHHVNKDAQEWVEFLGGEIVEQEDADVVILCKWGEQ